MQIWHVAGQLTERIEILFKIDFLSLAHSIAVFNDNVMCFTEQTGLLHSGMIKWKKMNKHDVYLLLFFKFSSSSPFFVGENELMILCVIILFVQDRLKS